MVISKAAKRYARALFDLARERNQLDPTLRNMQDLGGLAASSPDFARFLSQPLISTEARARALDPLLRTRLETLTYQFLLLLDEKRRLNILPQICVYFEELVEEHRGVLKIRITSARELEAGQVSQICQALKTRFNKDIHPETAVDPSLIGGFKIRVGDTIYDHCISTRLESFKNQLINA